MSLTVLLDATAVPADRGGVGRYIDSLVPILSSDGVTIKVVCQPRDLEVFSGIAPGIDLIPGPQYLDSRPYRLAWEQAGLPALIRRLGVDVLHSPHYTVPRMVGVPCAVTLHDATFFSHPELHSPVKARFFRSAIRTAVRRGSSLIVPSLATQSEVQRFVGGIDSAFHVAYHGVDANVFGPATTDEIMTVRRSLGLSSGEYIAFLGTLEPRKNVPELIRAWVKFSQLTDSPPALVLAGGEGWDSEIEPAIAEVPDGLLLVRPGYLPLEDLRGFLAGATVVAYPSLGEGFGLPVLEAMACGAAVLTTRELSLPEVGGDAVEYCGVSSAEIVEGLVRLFDDESRRIDLSERATVRAQEFTWERAAAVHRDAYRAAASETC